MNKLLTLDDAKSLLRHFLTAFGGGGIATSSDDTQLVVSALVFLAGLGWSYAKNAR